MSAGQAWQLLIGAACTPFVLLPLPVLIIIGARMLARSRRWGIALTGVIISLAVGLMATIGWTIAVIIFVLSFVGGAAAAQMWAGSAATFIMVSSCGNLVLLTAVAFFSTFAGIVGLRVLLNREIQRTFA